MYLIFRGAKTNHRALPFPANCQYDKKGNEPKVTIKIMANKEIPTDVQYGYYCIINSRPLTLNEWRNLKQKYPEYFTE